jgi:hypothetical protein
VSEAVVYVREAIPAADILGKRRERESKKPVRMRERMTQSAKN